MSVLVDSDILIEVTRGRHADIATRWLDLGRSDAAILYCPVSVAELWAGARPAEHDALTQFFGALTCVPVDAGTGRLAGDYMRLYGKSHAVQPGDALIAASVVISGAALWTRNKKHYPMKEVRFF